MHNKKTLTVLGAGAWGTALATILAHNGYRVLLWCYEDDVARDIASNHVNSRYLPGVVLDDSIVPITDIGVAVASAQVVIEAVPVAYLRSVLECAGVHVPVGQQWVATSKGIEQATGLLPTEIIKAVLPDVLTVVLSGASFARDVARKQLTGLVCAAPTLESAQQIAALVHNTYTVVDCSTDLRGVQACGALKNIVAIMMGVAHGAHWADNTRALLFTRARAELIALVTALGGTQKTLDGIAGIGDLTLTATNIQSRNFSLGVQLGQGKKLEQTQLHGVSEGLHTLKGALQLAQGVNIPVPLISVLAALIAENQTPAEFQAKLYSEL